MKSNKLIIAPALLLIVMLGGCTLNSNNNDPTPSTPHAGVAFFHAAPASPSMDVIMDNTTISTTAFAYSKFSGYLSVTPGSRSLRFSSVGDRSTQLDTTINVLQDVSYSFVLYNKGSKCKSILITDVPQTFASTRGSCAPRGCVASRTSSRSAAPRRSAPWPTAPPPSRSATSSLGRAMPM